MIWIVLASSVALAGVAAAGVIRPFGASGHVTLERLADPLEDERLSLLRALRDLDEERALGSLSEEAYRALRTETEGRAVAVLRALEARDGAGDLAAGLRELRPSPNGHGGPGENPGRRRRIALWSAATLAAAAVVGVLLVAAVRNRAPNAPITGNPMGQNPLAFFEQRVRDHPRDLAARLDLADRYMQVGDVQGAVEQYLEALKLDPRSPEAHANLGLVLYRAGKSQEALDQEDLALTADPNYALAMYFKGVILLQGLSRPADAAQALQGYLAAAPFGSYRASALKLLQQATSASTPSPSP